MPLSDQILLCCTIIQQCCSCQTAVLHFHRVPLDQGRYCFAVPLYSSVAPVKQLYFIFIVCLSTRGDTVLDRPLNSRFNRVEFVVLTQVTANNADVPPGVVNLVQDFLDKDVVKRGAVATERGPRAKQLHLQGGIEMYCNPDRINDLRKVVKTSLGLAGVNTGYKVKVSLLSGEHTFEGQLGYSQKKRVAPATPWYQKDAPRNFCRIAGTSIAE